MGRMQHTRPGRARLATKPVPTGTVLMAITIRNHGRLSLDYRNRRIGGRHDYVHLQPHQFRGELSDPLDTGRPRTHCDR